MVLAGYTTVDLYGAYRILGGSHGVPGLSLTLRVANLFNRQYIAYCNSATQCYYGADRSVIGTVRYQW